MSKPSTTDPSRPAKETWKSTATRWWKALDSPLGFFLTIFGAAAAYITVIEWRVNSIVKDPDFRQEIARRVRPAMVFDAGGRVLADVGALGLLEGVPNVKITTTTNAGGTSSMTTITVRPKGFLAVEPILESLDDGHVSVSVKRVGGTAWEILVTGRYGFYVDPEFVATNLAPERYRLELVPQ